MTEIFFPPGVKVQGNDKIVLMTGVANQAGPSLATEVNAATSVEITEAAFGTWSAPVSVNTGNSPTRIGTQEQLPEEGNAQRAVIPLAYPVNPSKAKSDPDNKLWALLEQGTILFAFVRRGISKDTAFAAGDVGLLYQVRAGFQPEPTATGTDEYAEYQVEQNLVPLAAPVEATLVA